MCFNSANGLGPHWFPASWRKWLTVKSSLYFKEANADKHDEGYHLKVYSRLTCDWRFYKAMFKDSQHQVGLAYLGSHLFSIVCFIMVRTFGWISWHFPEKHRYKQ